VHVSPGTVLAWAGRAPSGRAARWAISTLQVTPRKTARGRCIGAGLLAGLLLAIATAPLGKGPLAFVALAPLLWPLATRSRPADTAWAGAGCGLAFFGLGLLQFPWHLHEPLVWGAFAVTVPLLSGLLALCAGLLGLLARRAGSGIALVAVPALWATLELARVDGPVALPWLRLADAVAEWPMLIQGAALGGATLVSAWIAAVNAAVAMALADRRRSAWAVPLLLGALAFAGRLPLSAAAASGSEGLRVAAVQPATPSAERFSQARLGANLGRLLALSRAALREAPDVVVLPEGAWPRWAGAQGEPFLGALANDLDTALLAGVRRAAPGTPWRWNSVVLAVPGGLTRVAGDKVAPLPFYERAPDTGAAHALARVVDWPGTVLAAREAGIAEVPTARGGHVRVGVLVCIDAAHPALARSLRQRGAELLVNVSNEAESGPWSARQHAALVHLRAVETGLALVRVANTGPSVWVDGWGREIARLQAGREEAGAAVAPPPRRTPPYVALGDAPIVALLFAPPLAGLAFRRRAPLVPRAVALRRRALEGRIR